MFWVCPYSSVNWLFVWRSYCPNYHSLSSLKPTQKKEDYLVRWSNRLICLRLIITAQLIRDTDKHRMVLLSTYTSTHDTYANNVCLSTKHNFGLCHRVVHGLDQTRTVDQWSVVNCEFCDSVQGDYILASFFFFGHTSLCPRYIVLEQFLENSMYVCCCCVCVWLLYSVFENPQIFVSVT